MPEWGSLVWGNYAIYFRVKIINYITMKFFMTILFFLLFIIPICNAEEFLYILNDGCILDLYENAESFFKNESIYIIKDPHGLLLRFELKNPEMECEYLTRDTYRKIKRIEQFLAKMNNPAIIEVHIDNMAKEGCKNLKKWEVSTLIANKIESAIIIPNGKLAREKINSVGFGEFLPPKNTSNNGGNILNRVDIMILCNISGE